MQQSQLLAAETMLAAATLKGRDAARLTAQANRIFGLGFAAAIMFTTAACVGQVVALNWNDLNLLPGQATFTTAKTGANGPKQRSRLAKLPAFIVAGIASMPGRHPRLVFGYARRELLYADWERVVNRMVKLGWQRLTTHEAGRHGFGTEMVVRQKMDAVTAAERGGWHLVWEGHNRKYERPKPNAAGCSKANAIGNARYERQCGFEINRAQGGNRQANWLGATSAAIWLPANTQ